jgi:hypothetical protein
MQAREGTEGLVGAEVAPPGLMPLEDAQRYGLSRNRLAALVKSQKVRAFRDRTSNRIFVSRADVEAATEPPPAPPAPVPAQLPPPPAPGVTRIFVPGPNGELELREVREAPPGASPAASARLAPAPAVRPSGPRPTAAAEAAFPATLLLILVAVIVVVQWPEAPSSARGQLLGLGGLLAFLASYIYPLRKHLRWMSRFSMQSVLRFHTTATVAGTTLAILHSGTHFGPNVATAAFVLMILLMASGVFGNWMYVHTVRISGRVTDAGRRVSTLIRVPQAFEVVKKLSGVRPAFDPGAAKTSDASRRIAAASTDSSRRAAVTSTASFRVAARATRIERVLQVWRIVHGSASYFFLFVLAAHVIVALCYRGNVLWSLVLGWLRRS